MLLLALTASILVPASECSQRYFEPFVVGGMFAQINDFPHAVFLSMKYNVEWICGASVLNQRIILTAAHCLYSCVGDNDKSVVKGCSIDAYAGSADINSVEMLREVFKIICHEHYDDIYVENDVALALTSESFPMGDGYQIKRVMIKETFPKNLYFFEVSGWGIIDDVTREITLRLKSVRQRLLTKDVCESATLTHPGTMCAGSFFDEEGPTSGDSGGAVVTPSHQQIGLVSFKVAVTDHPDNQSIHQDSNNAPSLSQTSEKPIDGSSTNKNISFLYYTNVSYYYKWISRNAVALFC